MTPLASLKALRLLACSGTQVSDLTPLAVLKFPAISLGRDPVSDLMPLSGFHYLTLLICAAHPGSPSLGHFPSLMPLQELDGVGTLVSDLTLLVGLPFLRTLLCRSTAVSDLAPLVGLASLQRLDCSFFFFDLSPLARLDFLQSLGKQPDLPAVLQAYRSCSVSTARAPRVAGPDAALRATVPAEP